MARGWHMLLDLPARHGRGMLVAGLLLGIFAPGLAAAMRPFIGEMIAAMLFLSALRIGPRRAGGALGEFGAALGGVAVFQLALPLLLAFVFLALGWATPLATGLILMAAASPISGSPNLTMMLGHDPAPALRLLTLGTALLPLTVIPVFALAPALGDEADVMAASARLLAVILGAVAAAFLIRGLLRGEPSAGAARAVDSLSALVMAAVVIGLMSAVGPAITEAPGALLRALLAAFVANLALQIATATILARTGRKAVAPAFAIVAGNRNIALFLTALPASLTDPLLLFIGCYQIPMYLTPLIMARFYRPKAE